MADDQGLPLRVTGVFQIATDGVGDRPYVCKREVIGNDRSPTGRAETDLHNADETSC
jgi:hypothetical protein